MAAIIEVEGLVKTYKDLIAVNNLSFSVQPGEVYGFLGQNGAGKSTTIRILLTLIRPTAGTIRIFGEDLNTQRKSILRRVGAVIERPDLYKYLSARENLKLFARLSNCRYTHAELMTQLEQVGLQERADSRVSTFSQGMKQRLGIAIALVHNPELIILDEPANGLDPQGIADIRNLLLHLSRNLKKTVLVSSHLLSEIELVADRMLIIDRGTKVAEGSVKELFNNRKMQVEVELTNIDQISPLLQASVWQQYLRGSVGNKLVFEADKADIPALAKALVDMGAAISSLQPKQSLEAYFLSLTTANQHVDHFKN